MAMRTLETLKSSHFSFISKSICYVAGLKMPSIRIIRPCLNKHEPLKYYGVKIGQRYYAEALTLKLAILYSILSPHQIRALRRCSS